MHTTSPIAQDPSPPTIILRFGPAELEAVYADGRWFFFWLLDGEPVELDPHELGSRACN